MNNMNAQTKLAPCPFCGNKAVPISVHYPEGQVRCEDSNCFLGYRWSCDQEAWNSRPDLLRIKELEEKVKELSECIRDCEWEVGHEFSHELTETVDKLIHTTPTTTPP